VCSALRIVVAFELELEELAVLPGVRGVGRSMGSTRPVYGARFATSMIGLIEFTAFLMSISWMIGPTRLGFRGGVAILVVSVGFGGESWDVLEGAASDRGARVPDFERKRSMSCCFLAFTLSCLLCLVILRESSIPFLACLASASFSCAIAVGLA